MASGAGVALLALGVLLRSPVPVAAGLPLLLAPLWSRALLGAIEPRLTADLEWADRARTGPASVQGRLSWPASVDREEIRVDFAWGTLGFPEGPHAVRWSRTANGVGFAWEAPVPSPGLFDLPPPRLTVCDKLGFAERPIGVRGAPLPLDRVPADLARPRPIRFDRTVPRPGESVSRARGESGEFFGVRPAAPRVLPRRINWRATARAGQLMLNEFTLERTGDAVLVVDRRPSGLGAVVDRRLFGVEGAAALGLSELVLRNRGRVGVAVFGEFLAPVPLGSGRFQRHRIRTLLTRTPSDSAGDGPDERLAVSLGRYYPVGTTTILLSARTASAPSLLLSLRRRGFPALVLSPSPVPAIESVAPLPPADAELARSLLDLVHRRELASAWALGPTYAWSEWSSLGEFVELLRRPRRQGGAAGNS